VQRTAAAMRLGCGAERAFVTSYHATAVRASAGTVLPVALRIYAAWRTGKSAAAGRAAAFPFASSPPVAVISFRRRVPDHRRKRAPMSPAARTCLWHNGYVGPKDGTRNCANWRNSWFF
jgi:hypothetical protein